MAAFHRKAGRIHPHLIVAGFDPQGKPLRIRPDQVKEMATMKFTEHARNAAGIGSPGLGFYSKPRAPLIADTIRHATQEQLQAWWVAGHLSLGRVVKGIVTSVTWDAKQGKKPFSIRLNTMEILAARAVAASASSGPAASLAILKRFLMQQNLGEKGGINYGTTQPNQSGVSELRRRRRGNRGLGSRNRSRERR